ncbi:hypothetical protein [Actinoallomurus iriomotensis]|uniref:Uncharacterized protein n=1 Tax=Actinoallomurus iriomotensis TaxID=478107 RepID=A0A9W6S449_9ACTN|nr:hypothetical protein Airi02_049930 [Actinoallomurus iriomotensis]
MAATTAAYASETVDAVVICGGAAGLNGALISARSHRSVVVIDGGPRNTPTETMHGLIGLDGGDGEARVPVGGSGGRLGRGDLAENDHIVVAAHLLPAPREEFGGQGVPGAGGRRTPHRSTRPWSRPRTVPPHAHPAREH